jgi:hypothetical protein
MKKIAKLFLLLGVIVAITSVYSFTNKATLPTTMTVVITVTNVNPPPFTCDRDVTLKVTSGGLGMELTQQYSVGTTTYTFNNVPAGVDRISSGMSKKCTLNETILSESKNGPFTVGSTQYLGVGISN